MKFRWDWLNSASDLQLEGLKTDRNLMVTAGAGAGKTSVLTSRFLNLILNEKVPPERILAVTFTRNAAAEMRHRIISELINLRKLKDDDFIEYLISEMPNARIVTYDSLFQTMLAEAGPCFGISPRVHIPDAWQQTEMENRVWMDFLSLLNEESSGKVMAGIPISEYRNAVRFLYEVGSFGYLAGQIRDLAFHPPSRRVSHFFDVIQVCGTDFAIQYVSLMDSLALGNISPEQWKQVRRLMEGPVSRFLGPEYEIPNSPDVRVAGRWIWRVISTFGQFLSGSQNRQEMAEPVSVILKNLFPDDLPDSTVPNETAGNMLHSFSVIASGLSAQLKMEKLNAGLMDFSDVADTVRGFLHRAEPRESEQFRNELSGWFDHVLVDEFQDTNFDQWETIRPFAEDSNGHLKSGGLFIVGDPKQSIFRFRGAQVSVFSQIAEEVESEHRKFHSDKSSTRLGLNENYRSDAKLLKAINLIFEEHFNADPDGKSLTSQVDYASMVPGKIADSDHSGFSLRIVPKGAVPEQVVAQAATWMADSQWSEKRLAIIAGKNKTLDEIAEKLTLAGLNFRRSRDLNILKTQEGTDILNLIRFLANPQDDLAFTGLWKSPFLFLADEGLLFLRPDSKTRNSLYHQFLETSPPDRPELPAENEKWLLGQKSLRQWVQWAHHESPADVLWKILNQSAVISFWMNLPSGQEIIRNAWRIVSELAGYGHRELLTMAHAADLLESIRSEEEGMNESGFADGESATIDLLSVHKSKGLTYDLVLVADDFSTGRPPNDTNAWIWNHECGLAIKGRDASGDWMAGNWYKWLKHRNGEESQEEANRVVYVALTRATTQVIVTGENKKKSWTERIHNLAIQPDYQGIIHLLPELPEISNRQPISDAVFDRKENSWEGFWNEKNRQIKIPAVDSWFTNFTATGLMAAAQCGTASRLRKIAMNRYRKPGAFSPAKLGTLVHEVIGGLPSNELPANLPDDVKREVIRQASGIQNSSFFLKWSQFPNRFEVPVFVKLKDHFLQGNIDWLIEAENRLIIVDFKSNQIKTSIQELVDQYRIQLEFYVVCCAEIFPEIQEFEAVIASTRRAEWHSIHFKREELPAITNKLTMIISEIEAGHFDRDFKEINSYECHDCAYFSHCYGDGEEK